jgi:lysophospholipase L1-like esterase
MAGIISHGALDSLTVLPARRATLLTVSTTDHQGLLAFGDSITNGGGEMQWGVAMQSWAQWLARAFGLPFTNYAVDGNCAADVVARQIPAHNRLNAVGQARYQLGCLYIGVNDVRAPDWDPEAYERDLALALAYLQERCETLLTVTIPLDLGRPRVGQKVLTANAIINRQAALAGAIVVDLSDFKGRELMMFDHVHPTAMGQIAVAERALDVLAGQGLVAKVRPGALADPQIGLWGRAQAAWIYTYRSAKQALMIGLRSRLTR